MEPRLFKIKSPRNTLLTRRPLFVRLLLTCFYTAAFLTAALYGFSKWPPRDFMSPALAKIALTEKAPREPEASPYPKPLVVSPPAGTQATGAGTGSLTFVKLGEIRVEDPQEDPGPSAGAALGKLQPVPYGVYGGNFRPFRRIPSAWARSIPGGRAVAMRETRPERRMFLDLSELGKKTAVKSAKTAPKKPEKRYRDPDAEAESQRAEHRARALEAEAAEKRLFWNELTFSGAIILSVFALMLIGSRLFHALHRLEHPESTLD